MENTLFNQMHEVENHHWWFVSRRNIIESVINKIPFHGKPNILDIGCGNGDNLEMLSKFGNLVAMERDVNALNRAQERNMCPVYSGDLPDNISSEINKDNDLIVMLDVLEHVSEDGECLANLKQYINDNGRLLITVPAYQFLWSK
ncbi:MAG: class I SAM-dependent methyltransferase, partial [Proteobacteria bacterium]|nr:class I SAM-dependent methyltransferase [Pseudomonadota bacterium]